MSYKKRICASPARSTVFQGPSRLFLFASIIASALFLVNCGSTKKTAESMTDTKTDLRQEVGVKVVMESGQEDPGMDTAQLTLPAAAVAMLPEGAEFSSQKGNTRISAFRGKGDSIRIRATGLRSQRQNLKMTAEASGGVTVADSTHSEASAKAHWDEPQARGQPGGLPENITVLLLLAIGVIIYWVGTRQKSD